MGVAGLDPTGEEGGPEYTVTSATTAQFGGYTLVHEIHDQPLGKFRHRATLRIIGDANFEKSGHWVDDSGISYVEHNGHKYYVAIDVWEPMFPEFFQVVGPYGATDISATDPSFVVVGTAQNDQIPVHSDMPFDEGVTETHPEDHPATAHRITD